MCLKSWKKTKDGIKNKSPIARTDLAIAALKGENGPPKNEIKKPSKRSGIKWAYEIDKLYENHPNEAFNLNDIRSKLAEQGLAEALADVFRSTISTALSRKVTEGKLVREKPGFYKKEVSIANFDKGEAEQMKIK
jgi:hypothetical protein